MATLEGPLSRQLIFEPQNSLEMSPDELAPLVDSIQLILNEESATNPFTVAVSFEEPLGAANNLWEILHVFLPSSNLVKDAIWTKIGDRITAFMRSRFRKPHEAERPRVTHIYGPRGEILKTVILRSADDDPDWQDGGEDRPFPLPRG